MILKIRIPLPMCLLCDCAKASTGNIVDLYLDTGKWPTYGALRGAIVETGDPEAGDPADTVMVIEVEYDSDNLPDGIALIEPQDVDYVVCVDMSVNNSERLDVLEGMYLGTRETLVGDGKPTLPPASIDPACLNTDLVFYYDRIGGNLYFWTGTAWTEGQVNEWDPNSGVPATLGFHVITNNSVVPVGNIKFVKDDIALITDQKVYRIGQEGVLRDGYVTVGTDQDIDSIKKFLGIDIELGAFTFIDRYTGFIKRFIPFASPAFTKDAFYYLPTESGTMALTSNEDGSIDATSDGYGNPGMILKTTGSGEIGLGDLHISGKIKVHDVANNVSTSIILNGASFTSDTNLYIPSGTGKIALTKNDDGWITTPDILDATSDGMADPGQVLKADQYGGLKVRTMVAEETLDVGSLSIASNGTFQIGSDEWNFPTGKPGPLAVMAQAVPDSTATDVAVLVTDFNNLLAKLRASGVISTT